MSFSKGSKSTSQSGTLSPEQRTAQWNNALQLFTSASPTSFQNGQMNTPTYNAPTAKTLSNEDYSALEQSILNSRYAPLDRQKSLDAQSLDSSMADRGLWSSGLALRAQNDLNERYAPQYAQAGADAATQRYGLQSAENQNLNTFNTTQAQNTMESQWRPFDYLKTLFDSTQGQTSSQQSSGGGGFGFSI